MCGVRSVLPVNQDGGDILSLTEPTVETDLPGWSVIKHFFDHYRDEEDDTRLELSRDFIYAAERALNVLPASLVQFVVFIL